MLAVNVAQGRFCRLEALQSSLSVFTMKVTYQWDSHGLLIQIVLLHCASSVANDLQMQQWLQQNGNNT
jgi:hypothetical protein